MILVPALQPIVYGLTAEVLAYEALARWCRGDQIVGPSDLGGTPPWGAVDVQMLAAIHARADAIADVAPRLFINVSKSTIADPGSLSHWIDSVARIAHGATFSIVIEITEGIEDSKLQEAWPQLRRLGVKLALDDFGDGRSSRARLVRYDWDYCKFEGHTVGNQSVRQAIRYCQNSGILPVVERVELRQDSEAFASIGLHWQQGFLHGKPILVDQLLQGRAVARHKETESLQHEWQVGAYHGLTP